MRSVVALRLASGGCSGGGAARSWGASLHRGMAMRSGAGGPSTVNMLASIFGAGAAKNKDGAGAATGVRAAVRRGFSFLAHHRCAQADETQRVRDVDAIFESLFGKSRKKTDLSALKYFKLYPKPVRKWVEDAKTPLGRFNREGKWVTATVSNVYQPEEKSSTRNAAHGLPLRRELPPDLVGAYRFGLTEADVGTAPEKVKEVLSFRWANQWEINAYRAQQIAKKFERSPMDCGSSEVQVARMTVRVRALTEHMRANHKDKRTKRALSALVSQRTSLMRYLKRQNVEKYYHVLTALNLKDV
jgi:small subunit ribosomal protein S15